MPITANQSSSYPNYDTIGHNNISRGLQGTPVNTSLPSNGVVIVPQPIPPTTPQSASIGHHHQHQQQSSSSSITLRATSPLTIGQQQGSTPQITSPRTPIMMNGTLLNGSGHNRSKSRLVVSSVNHHSTSGLISTSLSPNGLGPSFSSTKQPLLDLPRANGHTPAGLGPTNQTLRNGGLNISRISGPGLTSAHHSSSQCTPQLIPQSSEILISSSGISEMLASLALMCLLSLLMAFLALFFLQRTGPIITIPDDLKVSDLTITSQTPSSSSSPNSSKEKNSVNIFSQSRIVVNTREYVRVFQISVSLSTLTISLNLCCLFVCCIQFLSAVKLLKTPQGTKRAHQFLKKTSHVRVTAIGAFLLSIPIFFTGVILFTFINFDELPALITSVIIGVGIVFCGLASVQNVYLWQTEKTKASKELSESRLSQMRESAILQPVEMSTLV